MYKPTNIQTVEQIEASLNIIQPFIEADYTADNINAVIDRAKSLEAYLAQSSKMLADAKFRYNEHMNREFINTIKIALNVSMPVSLTNKFIDTTGRNYKYLVDWCDRINATLTHELDFSRSLLSKLKEEMKQFNY